MRLPEENVENMKEFMTTLMEVKVSLAELNTEVKVSLAELNGKIDNLHDVRAKVDETHELAKLSQTKQEENEKNIEHLRKKVNTKASKEDVERVVKQRENLHKNLPAYIAIFISVLTFLTAYVII